MPIFEAMECKQQRLILGLWADEPVTVWKFDDKNNNNNNNNTDPPPPFYATLVSSIHLAGYGEVKALDLDAHLAVLAFDRTPR